MIALLDHSKESVNLNLSLCVTGSLFRTIGLMS